MYAKRKIGVVVPCYNEENLIGDTLRTMPKFVDQIYVVDDNSMDATLNVVHQFQQEDSRIKSIHHMKNKGVGAAIYSGYIAALADHMDIVAVMAGDHQMDPSLLAYFLDPIVWGDADYTKGNRLLSPEYMKGMSRWRMFGNSILTFLTKLASGYWNIMDPQNGYTAISSRALKTLDFTTLYPGYGYCNDLLVKLNVNDCRVIDVVHPARYGNEKSKIKYGRYILRLSFLLAKDFFWRMHVKYAVRGFHPLYFFFWIGLFLIVAGGSGLSWAVVYYLFLGGEFFIRGALSLFIFLIGLQFLFFGMLFDQQQKLQGPSIYYGGNGKMNDENHTNIENNQDSGHLKR